MNIRDIVNRQDVNLLNCESEPIHIPGSIQPHGFLLGLEKESLLIHFCSANTADYIHITPAQLLDSHLATICSEAEALRFREYIDQTGFETADPFVFTIEDVRYNTTTHFSGSTVLLEFEPFPDGNLDTQNLYRQTKKFTSLLERTDSLKDLCQVIAEEIRSITGYDRVMIYRFDKDYNGQVYAEDKRADLEPFFELNYPHTDIPAQARQLYLRNLMRLIVDVNYTPVPILTKDDGSAKNLDLSLSVLRSVSPIHIEYLQNMGVGATLTISLIEKGKLWGLVACHHYSYKNLPHYTRLAAKLQGHFLASQISVREVAEAYRISQQVEVHLQQLLDTAADDKNWHKKLFSMDGLCRMANASGVVAVINGNIYQHGNVPPPNAIKEITQWLVHTKKPGGYHTSNLAEIYPGATEWPSAAGLLYHPLSGQPAENCIVWLKEEVIKTVNWAGNPEKAVVIDTTMEKLSPRKSFALWQQSVRHQSRPWVQPEIHAASRLSAVLQNHLHTLFLEEEETRYRMLNAKLQQANEELSNINWITTHDMKEPLRKIRLFTSQIMETGNTDISDRLKHALGRIESATVRMQSLIDDILSYSLLDSKRSSFVSINLEELIAEIRSDMADEIADKNVEFNTDSLPLATGILFYLKLLFVNLISNAIKFSTKDNSLPVISITHSYVNGSKELFEAMHTDQLYLKICVSDNGIGFNPAFSKRIFDVFYRLHTQDKYSGNGIGLAICKKVMDTHSGFIDAMPNERGGATFCIYLPEANPDDN